MTGPRTTVATGKGGQQRQCPAGSTGEDWPCATLEEALIQERKKSDLFQHHCLCRLAVYLDLLEYVYREGAASTRPIRGFSSFSRSCLMHRTLLQASLGAIVSNGSPANSSCKEDKMCVCVCVCMCEAQVVGLVSEEVAWTEETKCR